jgi:hypothetical protein
MASLAVPLIEAAATRVVAALGVGAAGAMAVESAQKREKEAEKAAATPIARVDACTDDSSKCKNCPPDNGAPYLRNTAGWSDDSITYQVRIAQMPPAPTGFLTEWLFNGVTFDGFYTAKCLLKEAKARYDQFFDMFRQVRPWWKDGADKIIDEAYRQAAAAMPRPPVQLRWHFMEPISYRYFSRIINAAYPDVEVVFQP